MGQKPSRAQLNAGVTRVAFWTIVEGRFNDPVQRRFMNMRATLDGVDSSLLPLPRQTATFLKDKFNDAKATFTQYVTPLSASGQNDPDRFRYFHPLTSGGKLNALGKQMMVMFSCTRKGIPFVEDHFPNGRCKLIPGGAGRDEVTRVGSIVGKGESTRPTHRKRSQPDDGVKDISISLSKIASCFEGRRKKLRRTIPRSN